MAKYVLLSSSSQAAGFYDSVINSGKIPSDAVAISDELWQAWINLNGAVYDANSQTISMPAPSLASFQAAVIAECAGAGAAIVKAIYATPTQQAAYQNAATIVMIAGGAPGNTSPFYAAFNSLVPPGMTPTSFAALVSAATIQSLALASAEAGLAIAVAAATTSDQLATALTAFETAAAAVVTALNAASPPSPIPAPAAISIPGVNA